MKNKTVNIGRAPEVTDLAIIEAGKNLVKQGKNITGFALRRAVGDKGSPKRLYSVWREYQSSHEGESTDEAELTSEITTALDDSIEAVAKTLKSIVKGIHCTVRSDAKNQITSAMNLAEQRQIKADEEMSDALVTIEEFQIAVNEKSDEIDRLNVVFDNNNELLQEQNMKIKSFESDRQEQFELFKLASSENEQLTRAIESKQNEMISLNATIEELKIDKISLNKQVDTLNARIKTQDMSLDKLVNSAVDKLDKFSIDSAA
jgi:chromosome segregation ATPase